MKSYIPILFICLLLACHKENNSIKPQPQKAPDIYVTGYGKHDTVISGSLYWKNGFVEPLPGGLYAMGIAFIGTDIYVAGNANYVSPDGITSTEAVYWKNGVMTKLGNAPSYSNGIMTLGSDVYIVGMAEVNDVSSAVYWKNGILDTLSGMPNSVANAITASGNDIYIAGNAGTNGSHAVYWKNGIQTSLENVLSSSANAITVSGTDVYVAGYIVPGIYETSAVYWKNGARVDLHSSLYYSTTNASAIAVSGQDVYVTGYLGFNMTYWKNASQIPIANPNRPPNPTNNVNGIVISGKDVYISLNNGAYSKNDTITDFNNGYATSIAVRP